MINYQQLKNFDGTVTDNCISELNDGIQVCVIPNDDQNTDWQQYQVWLSEGNQPLPPAGAK